MNENFFILNTFLNTVLRQRQRTFEITFKIYWNCIQNNTEHFHLYERQTNIIGKYIWVTQEEVTLRISKS